MNPKDFTLHSGGAKGADTKWDEIGREFGVVNHFHYWYKKPNPKSLPEHEISEEDYQEGVEMIQRANKILKRQNIDRYMHLLARNWLQVKNADSIFAIGMLKGKKQVQGGTGWAVQMAIDEDKDVYVFDQEKEQWYYWNNVFVACTTPRLTKNYAGIGTRKINDAGILAIRNVYKRTFTN